MPRAGAYLKKEDLKKPEISYPLDIYFCENCYSVQLLDIIPRETLFDDYRYLSSVASNSVLEHFEMYANEIDNLLTKKSDLVLEIACNDGILLKPIKDKGINCLGVDPASNIVNVAKEKGLNVINDFFGEKIGEEILDKHGSAEIIVANAVFAHVDDMDDMTSGISKVLSNSGTFIFEVHHLVDIIEDMQYDSFYHEHFSYHSIITLSKFLKKYDMEICNVKKFSIRGGMIRVYAKKNISNNKIDESVREFINQEQKLGLDKLETYQRFAKEVNEHKLEILNLLKKLKSEGKKIVAYGMSGRGNTLLNYWKVGTEIIDYGIDASPERYDRFVPGMHIPIRSPENSLLGVDYALLLAWIFKNDIIKKENDFIKKGGKFIIPMPKPHLEP
jgi:methylation protein EvaC